MVVKAKPKSVNCTVGDSSVRRALSPFFHTSVSEAAEVRKEEERNEE